MSAARWLRSADCAFVALALLGAALLLAIFNLVSWRAT
jgi:hypothetical protein